MYELDRTISVLIKRHGPMTAPPPMGQPQSELINGE